MGVNEIEIAWAAGFFDGEGCVSGFHDREGRLRLQLVVVQSKTNEHLIRFKAAVQGEGHVNGPYKQSGHPEWSDRYTWKATGTAAHRVMEMLRPYLCSQKIEKYESRAWAA